MSCFVLPAGPSTFINVIPPYMIGSPLWSAIDTTLSSQSLLGATQGLSAVTSGVEQMSTVVAVVRHDTGSSNLPMLISRAAVDCGVGGGALPVCAPTARNASAHCVGLDSLDPFPTATPASSLAAAVASSSSASLFQPQQLELGCYSGNPQYIRMFTGTADESATSYRPTNQDFYRLRRLLRRLKQRGGSGGCGGGGGTEPSAKGQDDDDGDHYPLFCVVCRVKLNARAQAKQHYHGRSHARRLRLLYGPPLAKVAGTPEDPALRATSSVASDHTGATTLTDEKTTSAETSSRDDDVHLPRHRNPLGLVASSSAPAAAAAAAAGMGSAPVSCDVYCSACTVSFNSTTQARQHYHGKSHAKRLRTSLAQLRQQHQAATSGRATNDAVALRRCKAFQYGAMRACAVGRVQLYCSSQTGHTS